MKKTNRTKAEDADYVRFGDSWRAEMMRMPKAALVDFLRKACLDLLLLRREMDQLMKSPAQQPGDGAGEPLRNPPAGAGQ